MPWVWYFALEFHNNFYKVFIVLSVNNGFVWMKVVPTMWYAFFKKAYYMGKKAYCMVMWHDHVIMWYTYAYHMIIPYAIACSMLPTIAYLVYDRSCFSMKAKCKNHQSIHAYSISQEHVSGQSGCQNCRVGSVTRITRDQRSSGILATDPTRLFWQPDWPQTCSWFDLTLYFNYSILGVYTLL